MQCREKTFFNPTSNNCDWPDNVDTSNCIQLLRDEEERPVETAETAQTADNLAE